MKITLCASIALHDEMLKAKEQLEAIGHEVGIPPHEIKTDSGELIPVKQYYEMRKQETRDHSWIRDRHRLAMINHFKKVEWCDAILVLNHDKNNIQNYIGPNTLLEMGLAFHLGKKIFMLNDIPEILYKEEILCMNPKVIKNIKNLPLV